MRNIRNFFAVIICKILIVVGKMMGKKGSSTPGSIALKISPTFLLDMSKKVKKDIIMVCGTNGKTTTNNLVYSLLKSKGNKVVCNNIGANMLPGIACAFVEACSVFGTLNADYACLECDEASLRRVVPYVKPNKIIITNLFTDQLDRYGEIDDTIALLNDALTKLDDVLLILNADDPLSHSFSNGKKCVYFGIDKTRNLDLGDISDIVFCPECKSRLNYNYYHYGHLGDYVCENCSLKRPDVKYTAKNVNLEDGISFDICNDEALSKNISLSYKGFYNIYNVLSALSVYSECGYTFDDVDSVLSSYKAQIGRMESFYVNSKEFILNLSKNPAGFNQAISTLMQDKRDKSILVAINDKPGDGTDVSWLWNVNFEKLNDETIKNIYITGIRKYDMALRLKYSGINKFEIVENNIQTLKNMSSHNTDICYLLVNYTALFDTQNNLKAIMDKKEDK